MPEGEKEEQEIENLFENITKENFPNLAKEIDFQEVQEAQRVPKKVDPRRNTPRHIILTLPKTKDKERILKTAREKETVTYKGVPKRLSGDFSKETLQATRDWKEVFEVMKEERPCEDGEKVATYKPEREASSENNFDGILILNF